MTGAFFDFLGRRFRRRIGRGSQRQAVLRNHIELHDKTAGVHVIGMHAQTGNRTRGVHNERKGVRPVLLAGLVVGHEQVLVPRVGGKVSGVGAVGEGRRWLRKVGTINVGETQILDWIQSGESFRGASFLV